MVGSGQLVEFGFSNPDRPRLGIEVLTYAQLQRRQSEKTLSSVHRTDFHQLLLITGGTGSGMVDFVDHPCAPGTLLSVCPGRVLRLPVGDLDAVMVLFTATFRPGCGGSARCCGRSARSPGACRPTNSPA
jgi:hypothetical protein